MSVTKQRDWETLQRTIMLGCKRIEVIVDGESGSVDLLELFIEMLLPSCEKQGK